MSKLSSSAASVCQDHVNTRGIVGAGQIVNAGNLPVYMLLTQEPTPPTNDYLLSDKGGTAPDMTPILQVWLCMDLFGKHSLQGSLCDRWCLSGCNRAAPPRAMLIQLQYGCVLHRSPMVSTQPDIGWNRQCSIDGAAALWTPCRGNDTSTDSRLFLQSDMVLLGHEKLSVHHAPVEVAVVEQLYTMLCVIGGAHLR